MSQYIGEAATSLGNITPSFLGGNQIAQFGQYMNPANQGLFGSGGVFDTTGPAGTALSPPSAMDTGTGPVPSGAPGGPVGPVPGATSAGAFPSPPAPMAESTIDPTTGLPGPMNPINASGYSAVPVSPATTAAQQAAAANPNATQSPFMQWLLGDVTGAKGAWSSPMHLLGSLGGVMEAVNRWQTMRTLQDPNQLAANANKLAVKMNKQAVQRITAPTEAIMAETGGINAPGLYSQAIASALAPYNYEAQERAIQEYIQALNDSIAAYPQGGIYGSGGAAQGGSQMS